MQTRTFHSLKSYGYVFRKEFVKNPDPTLEDVFQILETPR